MLANVLFNTWAAHATDECLFVSAAYQVDPMTHILITAHASLHI